MINVKCHAAAGAEEITGSDDEHMEECGKALKKAGWPEMEGDMLPSSNVQKVLVAGNRRLVKLQSFIALFDKIEDSGKTSCKQRLALRTVTRFTQHACSL